MRRPDRRSPWSTRASIGAGGGTSPGSTRPASSGRPAERRCRPGAGLLRARRHRADGDGRKRCPRPTRPGVPARRRPRSSTSTPRRRVARPARRAARPRTGARRARASSTSPTTTWRRRCASSRPTAATTRAAPRSSPTAAPARCTRASSRGRCRSRTVARPALPGRVLGVRRPARRHALRLHADRPGCGCATSTSTASTTLFGDARAAARSRTSGARASREAPRLLALDRHALRRPELGAERADARRRARRARTSSGRRSALRRGARALLRLLDPPARSSRC